MRVPPFAKINGQKTLCFTGPSYRNRHRVRFPDVGPELALEPLDHRDQKRLERIAQRAQIEPRHLMGSRHQHIDVALQAAAFEDAYERLLQPLPAFAARCALTARLVRVKT